MISERCDHLIRFYNILDELEAVTGGKQVLANCSGRMLWPDRGLYFFFEVGEKRYDTGVGPRIVRVGTHALKTGSKAKLWTRLSQHKGQAKTGGGNHRGSIFRLIVGTAISRKRSYNFPTWGEGQSADKETTIREFSLEFEVTDIIGNMPFLWIAIEDEAGPESLRGYIERNSIALLSNYRKPSLDRPSEDWLGTKCDREKVRLSGLWNSNHVDENYDPKFLDEFQSLVRKMKK